LRLSPRYRGPRKPRVDGGRVGAGSVLGIIFVALAFSLIIAFVAAYNARTSAHVLLMERRLQEEALRSRELLRIYLINNTETGAIDVVILNAWDRGSEIIYQLTVDKSGAVIDEGGVDWSLPPRMTLNLTLTQPDVGDFKVVSALGNVFASSLPGLFMEGETGDQTQTQTTSMRTAATITTTTSGVAATTVSRTGRSTTTSMTTTATTTASSTASSIATTTSEAPVHYSLSIGIDPAELSGSTLHATVTTPDGNVHRLEGTGLWYFAPGSRIRLEADRRNGGYYHFYQWDINDRSFTTVYPVVEIVLDEPKTCVAHYTPHSG